MPLDPQAKQLLEQMKAAGAPPFGSISVEDTRKLFDGIAALGPAPAEVASVTDREVPGPAGAVPIRVYRPSAPGPLPVFVYLHGGGWVIGSFASHDGACRALANGIPAVVVAADYRLAPEHKFPAAPEDCYAVVRWVAQNAASIGGDPKRLAVGGDSAGGNLSAAVCLMARDRGGPKIGYQLLLYPVTQHGYDTESYRQNADGYLLTRDGMVWFWNHYLASEADGATPYASPMRAKDLAGLPPAMVVTAEYDPLRDEGEAYAERLRAAGVPVVKKRYDGLIHGFFSIGSFSQAAEVIRDVAAEMKARLA